MLSKVIGQRNRLFSQNIVYLYSKNDTIHKQYYSSIFVRQLTIFNKNKEINEKIIKNASKKFNLAIPILQEHIRKFQTFSAKYQQQQQQQQQNKDEKNSSDGNKNNNDRENDYKLMLYGAAWAFFSYIFVSMMSKLFPSNSKSDSFRYISWSEFYHQMLSKGEVELIVVKPELDLVTVYLYEGAVLRGEKVLHRSYHMPIVDVPSFEAKLRKAEAELGISSENSVQIIFERNYDSVWFGLIFVLGVVFLMSTLLRNSPGFKGSQPFGMFPKFGRAKFTIIDPMIGGGKGVKFSDVAGLKEAKVEIMEFVDYLKTPEKYKKLGAKIPRGVLLLGPPGCGKTMLAKAVATEASVPFLAMNGSEFIEMIGGVGAARVRDLFAEAKKRKPCIVYIDEIDAIGRKRSDAMFSNGEGEQTLNQLLVEMDGMSQREGVIMLASTNRSNVLDRALLRPGRFDRHILIDYPTLEERKEMFCQHLSPIKLEKKPEEYATRLAQLTPGFSGAHIANVANEAALIAVRNGKNMVDLNDLEAAVERVVGGAERSVVMSKKEKRIIAFHECGHALVGWLLPNSDALLKISLVPRTSNALGFSRYLPSSKQFISKEEFFDKMCMALGGKVAEQLIFNHLSNSAQGDLEKVTKIAYSQTQVYGMNDIVGPLSFDYENNQYGKKPFSKMLRNIIDVQSRLLVAEAHKHTENLLKNNIDKLKLLTEELLKNEVLNYKDIEKLLGPPIGGSKKNLVEFFDVDSLIDPNIGNRDQPNDNTENDNTENDNTEDDSTEDGNTENGNNDGNKI